MLFHSLDAIDVLPLVSAAGEIPALNAFEVIQPKILIILLPNNWWWLLVFGHTSSNLHDPSLIYDTDLPDLLNTLSK